MTLLAIAFVSISVASCKKDYTCECVDTQGRVTDVISLRDTKSSAQATCNTYQGGSEICTIK